MELITQYSRAYRRAYERSISEQKYENHPHFSQDDFLKGQSFNLRKIQENCSYQRQGKQKKYTDKCVIIYYCECLHHQTLSSC